MNLHGFIYGNPPRDRQERLCLALIWPREPLDEHGGVSSPIVAFGWETTIGFMRDDGWIGWNYNILLYHPTPIEARNDKDRWLTHDVWLDRLSELLQKEEA